MSEYFYIFIQIIFLICGKNLKKFFHYFSPKITDDPAQIIKVPSLLEKLVQHLINNIKGIADHAVSNFWRALLRKGITDLIGISKIVFCYILPILMVKLVIEHNFLLDWYTAVLNPGSNPVLFHEWVGTFHPDPGMPLDNPLKGSFIEHDELSSTHHEKKFLTSELPKEEQPTKPLTTTEKCIIGLGVTSIFLKLFFGIPG
jgi:hypothetical protein